MNLIYFAKSAIGYSHVRCGKPCQDFSAVYHDEERTIVTACDGHGGNLYIRSHLGSKFASEAVIKVFSRLTTEAIDKLSQSELVDKLKLNILCEWNALVERSISDLPLAEQELEGLGEEDVFRLTTNRIKAYGSTLNCAMLVGSTVVCASLGDGGIFLVKDGEIVPAFEDDEDEPVANVTYSLCQEDAFKHLKIGVFAQNSLHGVAICTDGVLNPYQNLANFNQSFVQPICALAANGQLCEVENFVVKLGAEIGTGDDVSLGLILKRPEHSKGSDGEANDI